MAYAMLRAKKRCPGRSLTRQSFSMISLKRGYSFLVRILLAKFYMLQSADTSPDPNTFARLSVFAMVLKTSRCTLSMNTFPQYYETHLHKKVVKDKQTKVEMVAHNGSYNFVPKKTKDTV